MNASRTVSLLLLALSLASGTFVGCGEDEPSPPAQSATGSGGTSQGNAGTGGGAGNGAGGSDTPVIGPEVEITYGDTTKKVDLGKLPTQTYKEATVIPLAAIWEAGTVGKPAADLVFDFEGDDGFRPSSKEKCKDPVKGADLDKGYLLPATRTLVWDDALGFAGCFGVKGLKTIIATDP